MHLESDLLRTFIAVTETGSFTRAAEIVGRTQSAVSLQIKKLEECLGEALFERGSRGVELTRPGRDLLSKAHRIVNLLDETVDSFRVFPLNGPVRIGLPEEYGHTVLGRALNAFARQHPNVDVTVRYGRSSENRNWVRAGELDLAVTFSWQEQPEGEVLMTDPTVWVTSDAHRVHERTPLPIALYTNSSWCTDFAMKSLEERGLAYRIVFTSDTNGGLKLAVSSGLAVAPLSRSNIPSECRELTAEDGFAQIDASRVVLLRNSQSSSAAAEGMASAVKEAFQFSFRG
jgi:DNA-binding transcriptional LysR family regulator